MASIYKSRLYKRLATGVVQWRAFGLCNRFATGVTQWRALTISNYTIGLLGYCHSAVVRIYKSGLYNRLATGVVQWCAFLHKIEDDNELKKSLTAGIDHRHYIHLEKCKRRYWRAFRS